MTLHKMAVFTDDEINILVKHLENRINNLVPKNEIFLIYKFDGVDYEAIFSRTLSCESFTFGSFSPEYYTYSLKIIVKNGYDSISYTTQVIVLYELKSLSVRELVESLLRLKSEFKYSKITDSFIKNDDVETEEKLTLIFFKLSDDENRDERCCVCFEKNEVKTWCNHNLCRPCHSKLECQYEDTGLKLIKVRQCPFCNEKLYNINDRPLLN